MRTNLSKCTTHTRMKNCMQHFFLLSVHKIPTDLIQVSKNTSHWNLLFQSKWCLVDMLQQEIGTEEIILYENGNKRFLGKENL